MDVLVYMLNIHTEWRNKFSFEFYLHLREMFFMPRDVIVNVFRLCH